jgi:hypothetical protein
VSPDEAGKLVEANVLISREDVARAKEWIMTSKGTNTVGMAADWMRQQGMEHIRSIDTDSPQCADSLKEVARRFSLHLAFYQATWELIGAGVLLPPEKVGRFEPRLEYRVSWGAGGIPVNHLGCVLPERIERSRLLQPVPGDTDIFLIGIDNKKLHSGIREAIDQALVCFRRGLYMPATAMLAAAAEATWHECGMAVAKKLADATLLRTLNDHRSGFGKVVADVRTALEHKNAKPLLAAAGLSVHQVTDAELWTTALRDRRNALHWGKSKSFIADHSETGTLLMAAPQHITTLEAIRAAC